MQPQGAGQRRKWLLAAAGLAGSLAGCASAPGTAPAVGASDRAASAPPALPARSSSAARRDEPAFARHLLNRFGYGPRPDDVDRLLSVGAAGWIDAQLSPADLPQPALLEQALAPLTTLSGNHTGTLGTYARLQAAALRAGMAPEERDSAQRELNELVRRVQTEARLDRLLRAVHGERQLEEVLVECWFNHFNVFAGKETVRVTAGYFEREAIRPHVLGRFRDLLGATARHPAMLNYLDNWQSVAPTFRVPAGVPLPAGFVPPRGVNENYARELLELHTLGVDGGYTQADVQALARILTGWSFDRRNPGSEHAFRFYLARHDRGPKILLGREVPGEGIGQGEWALDLLASHPATAHHVARRLARTFVADEPPRSLVDRLAVRFVQTDGDLREVVRALAFSPEFADPAHRGAKFKTPYHYVVSSVRAIGSTTTDLRPLVGAVARMGMPIHGCVTPDGWRDDRQAWLNPDALRQRVEFSVSLAGSASRQGPVAPPEPVLVTLGPVARDALGSLAPRDRLVMALASPDFMKR